MKIHVTDGYFVGFGRHIIAGDYEDGSAGLFGVSADYLVKNGHATVIRDEPTADDTPSDWTLAKLKERATELGLAFTSRATKAELIALITDFGGTDDENSAV